jgi:Protein of unknown function (DUF3551)
MLRYRNLRTLAAASAKAENTENALKPRELGYSAAGLFALAFVGVTSTAASAGEYCRWDVTSHLMSCSFDSLAQCQAMSSGRGGDCARDPFLGSPSNAYAYQPKHPRSKTRKPVEN